MYTEFLKNTLWIFNHPNPETIPSYYVSGLMPAHFMNIKKIIFLDHHNPEELLNHFKPKCLIISKALSPKLAELVILAKGKGVIIISIFDDWNFENKVRSKLNLPIAKNSNFVISKTNSAANEILKHTSLKSLIIPDPIRFNAGSIPKTIKLPLEACWFGMHTNHDTILYELNELDKINIKIKLTIISNTFEKFESFIKTNNLKNIILKFIKWNNRSDIDILKNDIVLLPYPNDSKRLIKSSNRIIDSINLGRFTVLSNVDQFSEFKEYTYFGKISDGLIWLLDNYEDAYLRTEAGQEYVNKHYSIKAICNIWLKLFKEINNI